MKETVKMIFILVVLALVIWLGKAYYDDKTNNQRVVNTDQGEVESLSIETLSRVEGYKFKIKNKNSLTSLLPEIIGKYIVTLPGEQVKKEIKSVSIELTGEQQEWYRVKLEDVTDPISSVGVSSENDKLTLKIYLSKDYILRESKEDRDWIVNNIALTSLYAMTDNWETTNLSEQEEIVKRLDSHSSDELPFEIL